MALSAGTIASSIAALSVPGVTVVGLDGIPETAAGRDCPLMYPRPADSPISASTTPLPE